jgi:hypothetical protein
LPPVVRTGLLGGLVLGLAGVSYYGLVSDRPLPDHRLIVGFNDIVLHVLAFAGVGTLAFVLFQPMVRVAAGLLGLGIALEALQVFSAAHEMALSDIVANGIGIGTAAVLVGVLGWVGTLMGLRRASGDREAANSR